MLAILSKHTTSPNMETTTNSQNIEISLILWDASVIPSDHFKVNMKVKAGGLNYWNLSIYKEEHWVIARRIDDLRPVIANELKEFFGIPKLRIMLTPFGNCGRYYMLIKTDVNPNIGQEMSLAMAYKGDYHSDDLIEQVQKIYAFRIMTGMTQNIDNSMIVRRVYSGMVAYSLHDSFESFTAPKLTHGGLKKKAQVPDLIFTRWFEPNETTLTSTLTNMLQTPIPNPYDDIGMELFSKRLDDLSNFLDPIINKIDPVLIWFSSEITNFLIGRLSP